MDAAEAFMQAATRHPVEECLEGVAHLDHAVATAGVDIAFSEHPHAGGEPRLYLLRTSIVDDLLRVGEELNRRGRRLVIEDGLRTPRMQRQLAQSRRVIERVVDRTSWEVGGAVPPLELFVRRLGVLVAPNAKVGTHMSASAVDVSVVDRSSGAELDRGGPYLEISERTPMASPFASVAERSIREEVTECMAGQGFVAYPFEFWHYSKGDVFERICQGSAAPARYGAIEVDVQTGTVTPLADPVAPLSAPDDLRDLMNSALARYAAQSGRTAELPA